MSRKLSEEEKHQNELMRDDRQRKRKAVSDKELDDRCYEILRILRDASENSQVQYNSKYFAKHFKISESHVFRSIKKLKDLELIKKQLGIDVDKKKLVMKDAVKALGGYTVGIKLHPKVTAEILLDVVEQK